MSKRTQAAVLGAAMLAGTAFGYLMWGDERADSALWSGSANTITSGAEVRAPRLFATALAAHERAAAADGVGSISAELERLAAEPRSYERDIELNAFLSRLSSIDPRAAVVLVERLELDDRLLVRAFRAWFELNPEAALGQLSSLSSGHAWQTAALALVDALGADHAAVERVASALSPHRKPLLRIAAVQQHAERDLRAAIGLALRLEPATVQSLALHRAAAAATPLDPRAALDGAALIPHAEQRALYVREVLASWASFDPMAVLRYLESIDLLDFKISSRTLRRLAVAAPDRLLALGRRMTDDLQALSDSVALDVMLVNDAAAAYEYGLRLTSDDERNALLAGLLERHRGSDAMAPLAYVLAEDNAPLSSIMYALVRAASEDLFLAAETAIEARVSNASAIDGVLATLLRSALRSSNPVEAGAFVDMIANHEDHFVRRELNGGSTPSWSGRAISSKRSRISGIRMRRSDDG